MQTPTRLKQLDTNCDLQVVDGQHNDLYYRCQQIRQGRSLSRLQAPRSLWVRRRARPLRRGSTSGGIERRRLSALCFRLDAFFAFLPLKASGDADVRVPADFKAALDFWAGRPRGVSARRSRICTQSRSQGASPTRVPNTAWRAIFPAAVTPPDSKCGAGEGVFACEGLGYVRRWLANLDSAARGVSSAEGGCGVLAFWG
jgi:hypothetical protein